MPNVDESRVHRVYSKVFEILLLIFLLLAGMEIILEKAIPVVHRWNEVVLAATTGSSTPIRDDPQSVKCDCTEIRQKDQTADHEAICSQSCCRRKPSSIVTTTKGTGK